MKIVTTISAFMLIVAGSSSVAQDASSVPLSVTNFGSEASGSSNFSRQKAAIDLTGKKASQFSLIIGVGAGQVLNTRYLKPIVDPIDNNVIIEKDDKLKSNISIGFEWTAFTYLDSEGNDLKWGPTFAVFANPVSLAATTSSSSIDVGGGVGWKFRNASVLFTLDFATVKQPRQYFVDRFKLNDQKFIKNGSTQTEISESDESIFKNKGLIAAGLKVVFPLASIKQLAAPSTD